MNPRPHGTDPVPTRGVGVIAADVTTLVALRAALALLACLSCARYWLGLGGSRCQQPLHSEDHPAN